MTEIVPKQECLFCHRDSNQTPLILLDYRESRLWICPQHLPVLIHDPGQLAGKLPGAENLAAAKHQEGCGEE